MRDPVAGRRAGRIRSAALVVSLLIGSSSCAWADPVIDPNPGGSTIGLVLFSAAATYVQTPVIQNVNDYSTTLLGYLNGDVIFQATYQDAFGSATVQSGVTQIDALLAGDSASFGAPTPDASNVSLLGSIASAYQTYSCAQLTGYVSNNDLPANITETGLTLISSSTSVGPETLNVDQCAADEFIVNPGQTAILENLEEDFSIAVDVPTTDTFLTSATYEIDGVSTQVTPPSDPTSVPESGTLAILAGGLGMLAMRRRRKAAT